MLKKLPVGISFFRDIIEEGYVYVDKTEYAYRLITQGKYYFLSRPRRFGKSLLIATLAEILRSNRKIFKGLWIASSDYHWESHGIIKIDFSKLDRSSYATFQVSLCDALRLMAKTENIDLSDIEKTPQILLTHLSDLLYQKYGKVAVLIDEYDSALLHNLHDINKATEIRSVMHGFFSTIKGLGDQVKFVFITGVSSFAKAGIFSGMNNLQIITLDEQYANICGYTDHELDFYFHEHIEQWAQAVNVSYEKHREIIRSWYNGYQFSEHATSIYNPFSILNALNRKKFENFWIQSGIPTFLINELKKDRRTFEINNMTAEGLAATGDTLGIFDIGTIPLPALLFQTGFLTIANIEKRGPQDHEDIFYILKYPNHEVRVACEKYLLVAFTESTLGTVDVLATQLYHAFSTENISNAIELIRQLFAGIPYQINISQEHFYHALLHMALSVAKIESHSEVSVADGRIDLVIIFPKLIYIIEIKFNIPAQEALDQIRSKSYHQKYLLENKKIVLLGIAFRREPGKLEITYATK